jgi:hypothetical protein
MKLFQSIKSEYVSIVPNLGASTSDHCSRLRYHDLFKFSIVPYILLQPLPESFLGIGAETILGVGYPSWRTPLNNMRLTPEIPSVETTISDSYS